MFQARWAYDGSAQGGKKIAFGNTWVIAAIVVQLPFCSSPTALPALFRLWRGKGAASQVELAAQLVKLLVAALPGRLVHGVGDAAFHGKALVIEGATWTTRLPANAALYGPKPPPTGKRGHPRVKGDRIGTCAQAAAALDWAGTQIRAYGQEVTVQVASAACLWYGCFKSAPGHLVLVRDHGSRKPYDLGLFTLDTDAAVPQIVTRYALRWAIEPANAAGKQLTGAGDARNRVADAVERTVPFAFLIQSLTIIWYAVWGWSPADIDARKITCPWYGTKTEPALSDMLGKLRQGRQDPAFNGVSPGQKAPQQISQPPLTCSNTAA